MHPRVRQVVLDATDCRGLAELNPDLIGPPAQLLTQRLDAVIAQERALLAQLDELAAAADASNGDDEHDPEGSTLAFERQQLAALLEQSRRTAVALRRALDDVAAGTWGTCEACGGAIGAERLAARPQARTCIGCARTAGPSGRNRGWVSPPQRP